MLQLSSGPIGGDMSPSLDNSGNNVNNRFYTVENSLYKLTIVFHSSALGCSLTSRLTRSNATSLSDLKSTQF